MHKHRFERHQAIGHVVLGTDYAPEVHGLARLLNRAVTVQLYGLVLRKRQSIHSSPVRPLVGSFYCFFRGGNGAFGSRFYPVAVTAEQVFVRLRYTATTSITSIKPAKIPTALTSQSHARADHRKLP